MVERTKKKLPFSERITNFVGTPFSIALHTIGFVAIYGLHFYFDLSFEQVNLILTTVVSLEAIYLALLIQMSVNRQSQSLQDVQEDIEEISEDVGEIAEDVEDLEKNLDEMQEDVEDLGEDMEKISEDISELSEEEAEDLDKQQIEALGKIQLVLGELSKEIEQLKKNQSHHSHAEPGAIKKIVDKILPHK